MGAGGGEIPAAGRGYDGVGERGYGELVSAGVAGCSRGGEGVERAGVGGGGDGAWVLVAARYPRRARV